MLIPWRVAEDHREGYASSVKWVRASGPSMGRIVGYMIFYVCIALYHHLCRMVSAGGPRRPHWSRAHLGLRVPCCCRWIEPRDIV